MSSKRDSVRTVSVNDCFPQRYATVSGCSDTRWKSADAIVNDVCLCRSRCYNNCCNSNSNSDAILTDIKRHQKNAFVNSESNCSRSRSNRLFPCGSGSSPQHQQPQLCSYRLLPTRHQTKNAILSILESGEVCVEFIKRRGHLKKELVCEVCRISPDGLRIVLYEPEGGKGVAPACAPPPLPATGTDFIYSFANLPAKHWKKYAYATKFVDLVKAKTPKVTYYSDKAKCLLMENLVDSEVCFYEGGKVTRSVAEGVKLIDSEGRAVHFSGPEQCTDLSMRLELLWVHSEKCREHCVSLEKTLSVLSAANGNDSFPIIVGRRPGGYASGKFGKENAMPPETSQQLCSFRNVSGATSDDPASNSSRIRFRSSRSRGVSPRRVSVPGIGVATQSLNGEVKVRYPDGSKLSVDGKKNVKYEWTNGRTEVYQESDHIPQDVMDKLGQMPVIIECLMSNPSTLNLKTRPVR